ncbi:NAD(P)/FAD-dependent oxidoreductase [Aquimarina litoralis]|uniref:NAD(P)/FAD-dependent oxidoreductase n=1 Tax=Aquimarina litoralis TaxID=584605 RepID=UPI001C59364E|nr:NAD(P)/FAD-dependent oxidoreductase [Aquimarina litoralis]MBW1297050.1 FAD-dependent oxidoreductase [Aquimarina litoralis]
MSSKKLTYDVCIIGAGVAGCATAIALKNKAPHLSVAIIERTCDIRYKNISSQRIGETIPPQTSQQLQQLGIWDSFMKCNFKQSFGTSASWGSCQLYHNEYMYSPYGYGWHLDRLAFDEFMINETQKRGVSIHFENSITSSENEDKFWYLKTISNQEQTLIKSRFIIDATGKKAAFSSLQKSIKIKEDQMVGIYCFYDIPDHTKDSLGLGTGTCVETDVNGWWYSSILPNKKLVISYMTDADIAKNIQIRKTYNFTKFLSDTTYTSSRTINLKSSIEPKIIAAHTQYLNTVIGNGWLAVGDAASSYDPISSLGIFKSLIMSQFAAYATFDFLKGDDTGLKKYQHIIMQDYKGYLKKRQEYYAQEKRYINSLFWERRHQLSTITN